MPHHRSIPRLLLVPALLAAGLTWAGCSGGPDMGSLSPADFYARFSGDWRTDSDAIARARETLRASRSSGRVPAPMGGDQGGVMDRQGRRNDRQNPLDPETRRLAMRMATGFPERMTVLVRDSLATVVGLHTTALVLPFGETVKVRVGREDMKVRAKWDGAVLVVERELGRAAVVDRLEPVGDGSQLILTRQLELGRVGGAKAELAYEREGR